MFDEGELTNDPDTSQRIVNNLLSIMLPGVVRSSEELVVNAHDNIFLRFAVVSRVVRRIFVTFLERNRWG